MQYKDPTTTGRCGRRAGWTDDDDEEEDKEGEGEVDRVEGVVRDANVDVGGNAGGGGRWANWLRSMLLLLHDFERL